MPEPLTAWQIDRTAGTLARPGTPSLPVACFLRFDSALARAVEGVLLLGITALTAVLLAQVISRYVVNLSLSWSEELARYLMVWLAFLGASLGIRSDSHYGIAVLLDRVGPRLRAWLLAVRNGSVILFFGFMIVEGVVSVQLSAGERSAALSLPMAYVYAVFAVAGAVTICHALARLLSTGSASWRAIAPALLVAAVMAAAFGLVSLPMGAALPVFLAAVVALLVAGTPIAVAIGVAVLAAVGWSGIVPLEIMIEQLFNAVNNFTLMAVPLFMLTGTFLAASGLADRLIEFAMVLVGRLRGGLAMVDVLASVLFADISGSSTSDTAAIGSTMIPGLVKNGYGDDFAVALQAASGSMGMLVPPSICTIVFATVAGVSVTAMFLSSLLPAVLMAGSFMLIAYVYARRRKLAPSAPLSRPEKAAALRGAILPLLTPIIILGGIFSGVFTPTEAGVVALVYTVGVGVLAGGLDRRKAREAARLGTRNFSMVFLVIGTATLLSWLLTFLQVPQFVASLLVQLSESRIVVLLVIMVLLALLHTAVETVASILIVTPILLPVLASMEINPAHFGVLLLMNSAMGLILPPLGLCLYISCAIGNVPLERGARSVLPFALAIAADLVILILFPSITLFVPRYFGAL
ncbi:MAG: TRAP transporter large permease subunit [Alphaproteobacteria bacterium]